MTSNNLSMPWLDSGFEQVISAHIHATLPHALLVEGQLGLGKRLLAERIAKRILCASTHERAEACGECKQCKLFEAGSHSDYRALSPEEGSSVIKVDVIRSLVEFLSQSSLQGGYKVALIEPAEAMNVNAANALLKTLEEPTPRTLIILVTHQPGAILATIRSRCQAIPVAVPSEDAAMDYLQGCSESIDEHDQLKSLLQLAAGSPCLAADYIEQGALASSSEMLEQLAQVLKRQLSVSEVAEAWADDNALTRMQWLVKWASDLCSLSFAGREVSVPEGNARKMLQYLADKCSATQLFGVYDYCLAQSSLLAGNTNPNKNLLFESVLNRWRDLMLKSAKTD